MIDAVCHAQGKAALVCASHAPGITWLVKLAFKWLNTLLSSTWMSCSCCSQGKAVGGNTGYDPDQVLCCTRLDGLITLVDAKNVERHLDDEKQDPNAVNEAVAQIAYADRILLNKTDLVSLLLWCTAPHCGVAWLAKNEGLMPNAPWQATCVDPACTGLLS